MSDIVMPGDLETARQFGRRVADATAKLAGKRREALAERQVAALV